MAEEEKERERAVKAMDLSCGLSGGVRALRAIASLGFLLEFVGEVEEQILLFLHQSFAKQKEILVCLVVHGSVCKP